MLALAENNTITKTKVSTSNRLSSLPRKFGRLMGKVEVSIFNYMDKFCKNYSGGYWEYYELSNGGFYMAPAIEEKMIIENHDNYFSGELSADAAGVVICLMVYSHLSFIPNAQRMAKHFHALREYALDHPEAGLIFAAID